LSFVRLRWIVRLRWSRMTDKLAKISKKFDCSKKLLLRTIHKRRSQSGEGRLSNADIWGGVFRCGRPHFLMQNTTDFSKFVVSAGIGRGAGWVSAGILRTSSRGDQCFAIMCGRHLWTAPENTAASAWVRISIFFAFFYLIILSFQFVYCKLKQDCCDSFDFASLKNKN